MTKSHRPTPLKFFWWILGCASMEELLVGLQKLHCATNAEPVDLIHKVLHVATEMLRARGCADVQVPPNDSELYARINGQEAILVGGPTPLTRIFFHTEDRVAVKYIRTIMEGSAFERTIIISIDGPTSFARKESAVYGSSIQFFRYKDLSVNITKHVCVPKHAKVAESTDIGVDKDKCPKMLQTDAVAAYYDFQPGDVVSVDRRFGTTDVAPFFRLVVNAT